MADQITSWADLQARAAEILARVNADPRLGRAAAANPLLAIERLDYSIDPEIRPALADQLRLGPGAAGRLADLRREVAGLAGRAVDPDDAEDVRRLLVELGIVAVAPGPVLDTRPPRWRPGGAGPDPLRRLRDQHPVLPPLLDYRRISAARPRFASERIFVALLDGERTPPVTVVAARLRRGTPPTADL
ncbi:hypothetical protein [Micromonospora sp. NBC_01796]|uniref:hypothetical protein n=1 Tax=Micromonospora sp. NBC_01796 TaxID=2975987 RepID=UPI002DDC268E|nr:hypothetical protein [Micromonospora sp. NBC_01796]WSA87101.1 hypothetical protein OIE47_05620 [Micromonospora sp. NBC_01796]